MNNEQRWAWQSGVLQEDHGDTVVVANPSGEEWLILDGTAIAIWRMLKEPLTVDEMVDELMKRYNGEADIIRVDVQAVVDRLARAGAVHPVI